MERDYILQMLEYCVGRVGGYRGPAELPGLPLGTLFSKMKKLELK